MSPAALADETRRNLVRVSQMLRRPSARTLDDALTLLRDTHARWRSLAGASAPAPAVASQLRRQLADCRMLAEQASALYLGLAAVVLSVSGTYTPAGEAVPLAGCQRVSVEG